jgi:hypothetical protein
LAQEIKTYKEKFIDAKLQQLALEFLEKKNFLIEKDKTLVGLTGQDYKVSFHIMGKMGSEERFSTAIVVLDYGKSIGTDVINKYDRVCKDLKMSINKLILVSNDFSVPAKNMAEKANLFLLSRGELVSILLTGY